MAAVDNSWGNGHARASAGALRGALSPDGAVKIFRGVPYAEPPVGALRWRPPRPVVAWSGLRPATHYGPDSVQAPRPRGSVSDFGLGEIGEDCLYLNVWSAATSPDERRPVMVWIHGGGFVYGSGRLPMFDGENLARRGVVVVTINYRLGPLGFLAHPDLVGESPRGVAGNYGFLDQIAALEWTRDNIANFGGDPSRVTIFGQSVGSSCVCNLVASPLTKGLIHRAISQSGGSMSPMGAPGGGSMQSLAMAVEQGVEFAARHGARTIEELRHKPAAALQLPPAGLSGAELDFEMARLRLSGWVIVDGNAIPASAHSIYRDGKQNHVPLISGANSHEGSTQPKPKSMAALEAQCAARFGAMNAAFFETYRIRAAADPLEAARLAFFEGGFNWQNWKQARLHAQAGNATYSYHFRRTPAFPKGAVFSDNATENLGAFHTAEIPFVFDNLAARDWPWTAEDRAFANTMSSYWTNFAATGDPNGVGLPEWPRCDPAADAAMIFGDTAKAAATPARDRLDFWERHYAETRPAGE